MASLRELKNEVNYLTFEIISDCNTFCNLHSDKKEQVVKLIEEAVALRNDLVQKINHPAENSKKYFNSLRNQLVDGADAIFEKLRKLIK